MRICLFTTTFFPVMGGVEVWCDMLTRGLISRAATKSSSSPSE